MSKKYEFLHYQPNIELDEIARHLAMNYQEWTVVSHSSNTSGMTILLVREQS